MKWDDPPRATPTVSSPGRARASSTNSRRVFQGASAPTAKTCGG
ncbi:hypothetical protein MGSAQ_002689 [marine sediment metagenome]|uniref:Uncharacterized protein n=1 Tax=marine sediment metagenome TaxID=412755 RepID=A0A1B6NQS5_9ZZZZ